METSDSTYCIRLVAINLMTAILALSQYSTCGLWNADMIRFRTRIWMKKVLRLFRNAWPYSPWGWEANVEDGKVGTGKLGVQRAFDLLYAELHHVADADGSFPLPLASRWSEPCGPSPTAPEALFTTVFQLKRSLSPLRPSKADLNTVGSISVTGRHRKTY